MRRLGVVPNQHQGAVLRDYLELQGTTTELRCENEEWALWIHNEDRMADSREVLQAFLANPSDPRYADASTMVEALRAQSRREQAAFEKRQVRMSDRWQGRQQLIPITIALMVLSAWVGAISQFGQLTERFGPLFFAEQDLDISTGWISYKSMAETLRSGQVYRWWSPILIHFGVLHLFFNLIYLMQYGQTIEQRSGSLRMLGMVVVIAFVSNTAQYLTQGPRFGGMSGVVFGLFGFLWMKSRFAPEYDVYVPLDYTIRFMVYALACLFGLLGPVANTAHFVGLWTGMALALIPLIPRLWRQFRQRGKRP